MERLAVNAFSFLLLVLKRGKGQSVSGILDCCRFQTSGTHMTAFPSGCFEILSLTLPPSSWEGEIRAIGALASGIKLSL